MRLIQSIVYFALPLTLVFVLGCGEGRPDPRENPDFNEEALNDPGSIELDTPGRGEGD